MPISKCSKLHKKIVRHVLSIVKQLNLPLRQSYTFVLKGIYRSKSSLNSCAGAGT